MCQQLRAKRGPSKASRSLAISLVSPFRDSPISATGWGQVGDILWREGPPDTQRPAVCWDHSLAKSRCERHGTGETSGRLPSATQEHLWDS